MVLAPSSRRARVPEAEKGEWDNGNDGERGSRPAEAGGGAPRY
jgi:hypothetical protein